MIRRPLFVCACMLSFGIVSALYLNIKTYAAIIVIIAVVFAVLIINKKKTIKLFFVFAAFFLLGNFMCNIQINFFEAAEKIEEGSVNAEGEIYKFEKKTYSTYVYLERGQIDNHDFSKIIVKISNDSFEGMDLKIGNVIYAQGEKKDFNNARNYGNFDEESYYHSLGISAIVKANEVTVTVSKINFIEQKLYELKCFVVQSFEKSISSDKAGIFSAIVAGDKSELDSETKQLYQDSGIAHILAISGLHISLIGMGLFGLLRRRLKFLPSAFISIIFMICFCIMSGSSVSAIRATIMFVISLIAIGKGKKYDILTALSLSAVISLAGNPCFLTNTGFLMSYGAIFSIGVINKYAAGFIKPKFKLSKSLIASISITFFSMPIVASTYFQIPLYSILLNLIVIPLMSFVLGSGLISGFIGILSIALGRFFIGIGIYTIYFIEGCSSIFLYFPFSIITTGKPKTCAVIFFYIFLFIFIMLCHWICSIERKNGIEKYISELKAAGNNSKNCSNGCRGKYQNNKIRNIKYYFVKILFKRVTRIIISVSFLFLSVLVITSSRQPDSLRIVIFDVDQGDGILFQNDNGRTYMIDGGSTGVTEVGKYRLKSGIKYFGIDSIDYEIITHPDTDHISGLIELIEDESSSKIEIKNILIPYIPENENYQTIKALADEYNINFINIEEGMGFIDGNLKLMCLHPACDYYSDSTNGYSTVLDLSYGNFNGLFVGDLEADGEERLINSGYFNDDSGYELLKVSHHGSKNSSTKTFLETVMPETAVISAGVDNSYGHPSKETLNRLYDIGSEIFVTSECGEIIIDADLTGEYNIETVLK